MHISSSPLRTPAPPYQRRQDLASSRLAQSLVALSEEVRLVDGLGLAARGAAVAAVPGRTPAALPLLSNPADLDLDELGLMRHIAGGLPLHLAADAQVVLHALLQAQPSPDTVATEDGDVGTDIAESVVALMEEDGDIDAHKRLLCRSVAVVAGQHGRGDTVDVNALVQWVLRQSYLAQTDVLFDYAQKVRFFNDQKTAIREQLTSARAARTERVGSQDSEGRFMGVAPYPTPKFQPGADGQFFGGLGSNTGEASPGAAQPGIEPEVSPVTSLSPSTQSFMDPDYEGLSLNDVVVLHRIEDGSAAPEIDHETLLRALPRMSRADFDRYLQPDGPIIGALNSEQYLELCQALSPAQTVYAIKLLNPEAAVNDIAGIGTSDEAAAAGAAAGATAAGIAGCMAAGPFGWLAGGIWALTAAVTAAVAGASAGAVVGAHLDEGLDADQLESMREHLDEQLQEALEQMQSAPVREDGEDDVGYAGRVFDVMTAEASLYREDLKTYHAAVGVGEGQGGASGVEVSDHATSMDELDDYIQYLEDELAQVGDDAQLANVDLQNNLQKQQQVLQMMSNISKTLHDTALAVIRKIGG